MRTVDLALFADTVAARAAALEARLDRARDRLRRSAIERDARRSLGSTTVERLEAGILGASDVRAERGEVGELAAALSAVRELQRWTEARLAEAQAEAGLPCSPGETVPRDPSRAA
ncbi:MAG TPA: hypothetical protein VHK22_00085 [Gaiellaceae bacterium]|jgi:hypothetical protein|nr:hypothetical protein [Gaiellaceae bacterium]